jgi:hypothetical protein
MFGKTARSFGGLRMTMMGGGLRMTLMGGGLRMTLPLFTVILRPPKDLAVLFT